MKKSIAVFLSLVITFLSIINPYYAVRADVTVSSIIDGTLYAIGGSFYLTKEVFKTSLNILGDIPSVERIVEDTNRLTEEVCSYAETIYQKINGQDTELVNISPDDSPIRYQPDNNTFVYSPTYIYNYNQAVQDSVTKLDGYYLLDRYIDADTLRSVCEGCEKSESKITAFFDRLAKNPFSYIILPDAFNGKHCMMYGYEKEFCGCIGDDGYINFYDHTGRKAFLIVNSWTSVGWQINTGTGVYNKDSLVSREEACQYFRCYSGTPFKIFYPELDLKNYLQRGKRYHAPRLPVNLTIPAPEINTYPTFISNEYNNVVNNMDSNLTETDIQNKIDTAIENYINTHQPPAVTDTPNQTITPGQNTSIDYTNILNDIYNALKSLTSGHSSFENRIFTYFESNNRKLDELLTVIDCLHSGQPSGIDNGCEYDHTELNGLLTSLWEESMGKYDKVIALLEENNRYQQQLIDTLDSIKNILLFDTAIELLKDRASQTADTAKGKFPTSLPWDVALVVNAMCAAPETPVIKCPVEINSLNIHEEFTIDLSGREWKKLAKTCRSLLSLLFVLYLIHLTRQLLTGGEEK